MRLGEASAEQNVEAISTGSLGPDLALGVGGVPRGRIVEIYGPESRARPPSHSTSWPKPKKWAAWRLSSTPNTRRTRLRRTAGRRHRQLADLPARHGRAGAGDRGSPGAQRCGGRSRGGLGGGAGAPGRDRRRDGRRPRRAAGPPHVTGVAQADRRYQQVTHHRRIHQPNSRKSRRHVRIARGDAGRTRPEVLLIGADGHSPTESIKQGTEMSATGRGCASSRTR